MANQIHFASMANGVQVPISQGYRNLIAEFSVSTFWYHVKGTVECARINDTIQIPGDDVETFVAIMRLYFENNEVYTLLEDETKEVTLNIYSHTTKYKMDKVLRESGETILRPLTPWSLTIKDL